jgi:hypothetical protein
MASAATAAEPAASPSRAATGMGNDNHPMAIKVIVELRAKPGRRAELKSLFDGMIAAEGPSQPSFLGSTRFEVLRENICLVTAMTAGSVTGTILGELLLGAIPDRVLLPAPVVLLIASAIKCARHSRPSESTDRTRRAAIRAGLTRTSPVPVSTAN